MAQYTLVFAFDESFEHVVLVEKTSPDWQAGRINGVGGKCENESLTQCASREFGEETGVYLHPEQLMHIANIQDGNFIVSVFACATNKIKYAEQQSPKDIVIKMPIANILTESKLMHNIAFLVTLSMTRLKGNYERYSIDKVYIEYTYEQEPAKEKAL